MDIADKGQIIVPTGGGKTVIMMQHCLRHLRESSQSQLLIVAPRILLSNQLYDEFWSTLNGKVSAQVMHVHSGEVVGFIQLRSNRFSVMMLSAKLLVSIN